MKLGPFVDQAWFMGACGQSIGTHNPDQLALYITLIEEELNELKVALADGDTVGILDGVTDVLVTTIGAGLSRFSVGQLESAWDEVYASNMSKVDPITGDVIRRADGKILKPDSYFKPNLEQFV